MNLAQMQADMAEEVAHRHEWAARVKAIRARLGLTQRQFGERLGCSTKAVHYWEAASGIGAKWCEDIVALEKEGT